MVNSTVYGPVDSWRLGRSLGIDLLCVDSICSFDCVYCQLGKIDVLTSERSIFVTTEKILDDLQRSDWQTADVVTFSGSGEPTLALNLGQAITSVKKLTGKPVAVLTNSSLLWRGDVRDDLAAADKVFCKLDAWSNDVLARVDRPVGGVTLDTIVNGIKQLRAEYDGSLGIQTMLLAAPTPNELEQIACLYSEIRPDEIQINLPLRPIPTEWKIEARGNLEEAGSWNRKLKTITESEASRIGREIAGMTGLTVVTPFDRPSGSITYA